MPKSKSPQESWTTMKIRRDLQTEIKKLLQKNMTKSMGITNTSVFVNEAIMELIEKLKSPKMHQVSINDDRVKILESGNNGSGKMITIFLKKGENVLCSHCKADNCSHVHFVWEQQNIRSVLMNNGMIPPIYKR